MSKQIDLHVLQFYEPKKLLGSGAYGHVWKVIQKGSKKIFALKKIFDAFQNSTDAQRTYREISLLHQMQHINVIKLHKVIKAKNKKDLYLVFQFMQSDLHSLVGQDILSTQHITFILYQVLKALKYVHSAQLLHRDLKPSNILINSDCQIKLCDFGLARSLAHQENQQNILSQEVATRWYRSPEILLNSQDYSKPTDIWSVGCILAQLFIGQPIFQGSSTLDQLQKIMQFTGVPSKYSIDSLKSDVAQNIINNLTVRRKSTKDYFRKQTNQNSQLINITIKMLQFNPSKRPTVEDLLKNPIFKEFEKNLDPQFQVCQKFIVPQIDDNIKLTLQQYRQIIYKDIERRYPQFNDAVRIKSAYSLTKKNKSFVEKDRKHSLTNQNDSLHNSHSNGNKSLPKTKQASNIVKKKKSVAKNVIYKPQTSNFNFQSVKSKFIKVKKQQIEAAPIKQYVKPQAIQQNKELVKKIIVDNEISVKKSELTKKKSSKNLKQNIGAKAVVIPTQQKASIYKKQLKKMKSYKSLLNKHCRPFQQSKVQ